MSISDCIRESNKIEGIYRKHTAEEYNEFLDFMKLDEIHVGDILKFVSVYQPNARLRLNPSDNVRVGDYYPPEGGQHILYKLDELLTKANEKRGSDYDCFTLHKEYESLHPFTDCNGRSGRMLWYWMMKGKGNKLGFLHNWYYQTLQFSK